MADIDILTPENFRAEIAQQDEPGVIANLILSNGGLHVLRFLREQGVTPEHVERMIEQIETNIGVIEQVAAERGISLEIVHTYFPK